MAVWTLSVSVLVIGVAFWIHWARVLTYRVSQMGPAEGSVTGPVVAAGTISWTPRYSQRYADLKFRIQFRGQGENLIGQFQPEGHQDYIPSTGDIAVSRRQGRVEGRLAQGLGMIAVRGEMLGRRARIADGINPVGLSAVGKSCLGLDFNRNVKGDLYARVVRVRRFSGGVLQLNSQRIQGYVNDHIGRASIDLRLSLDSEGPSLELLAVCTLIAVHGMHGQFYDLED